MEKRQRVRRARRAASVTWIVRGVIALGGAAACSGDDSMEEPAADASVDVDASTCAYEYSGTPSDACLDMADTVARAAERCGQDYQSNYDGFIEAAADGDCDNITLVRDAAELYDECIPWFCTAACDALTDADQLPDGCREQLVRAGAR